MKERCTQKECIAKKQYERRKVYCIRVRQIKKDIDEA